ncbi:hypothetical protein DICPUDRAFT_75864 [Dictyostelium purpureum]|uniref:Uncharacterized protein n=1 Tax=Dictyostelium purpureum TaxID=5786 RepID=F0ZBW4_DICPU|nr:uncharacterized protein DICPUDRAFT_75864 [Dictyostelium purpureum]EGC38556.1 hypothetical protein DICPUDRAFT_75864 [Dictyostelium purpureum]|eukprot:XP_003284927.1 hypothetical protein DICPUDRAFT_75864 [Dictyostelium purpureum]
MNNNQILTRQNHQIDVICVGNRKVGKSEFLKKYCQETINPEFKFQSIVKNDKYFKFRFYDVEEFYPQLNRYLGAIFVYDITDPQSFEDIKSYYYKHYLRSRKDNLYVKNNKDSNDEYKEDYNQKNHQLNQNIDDNDSNNNDNIDNRMDELFFKVFRNLYIRNLIFQYVKKRDIIVKFLIGTKLDLKNKNKIYKDNGESDTDDIKIEINSRDSTTNQRLNKKNKNNNYIDSDSTSNYVSNECAKEFAEKIGAKFYEVSSVENLVQIDQIFEELIELLTKRYEVYGSVDKRESSSVVPQSILRSRNNLSSYYFKRKCIIN